MYYAYVYSILSYAIILWGTAGDAQTVFKSRKSIFITLALCHPKTTFQQLFEDLEIFTFT